MNLYDELIAVLHDSKELGLTYDEIDEIIKALERAKKVEELLRLYQQKEKLSKNPYKNIDTKELKPFYEWACEIEELENKIQALEEELK